MIELMFLSGVTLWVVVGVVGSLLDAHDQGSITLADVLLSFTFGAAIGSIYTIAAIFKWADTIVLTGKKK